MPTSQSYSRFWRYLKFLVPAWLATSGTMLLARAEEVAYPPRNHRYLQLGWNHSFQHCYRNDEVALLNDLQREYVTVFPQADGQKYFALTSTSQYFDLWTCQYPTAAANWIKLDDNSFTLPTRIFKDLKHYPLWDFADQQAKQIANWQSMRVRGQPLALHNDPVMLVFEELKDWVFNTMAIFECNESALKFMSDRQSFIKRIIHHLPDHGTDKLNLHNMQAILSEAANLIHLCIAKKELPEFLSESITAGKSLELTVSTFLHFLMVNEKVADNISLEDIYTSKHAAKISPLNKVYQKALTGPQNTLALTSQFNNPYYHLVSKDQKNYALKLRVNLISDITFASFASHADKRNYLEANAILHSIYEVRLVLESFQQLLPQMGSLAFAVSYLENVKTLSGHYIKLIEKLKHNMQHILRAADEGLKLLYNKQLAYSETDQHFLHNLRSLETRVVQDSTVSLQLEKFCANALDKMMLYQLAMHKLVRQIYNGEAEELFNQQRSALYSQIARLNIFLPAVLNTQIGDISQLALAALNQPPPQNALSAPNLQFYNVSELKFAEDALASKISRAVFSDTQVLSGGSSFGASRQPVKEDHSQYADVLKITLSLFLLGFLLGLITKRLSNPFGLFCSRSRPPPVAEKTRRVRLGS